MRTKVGIWVNIYLFAMSLYWIFGDSSPVWWTFYQVNKEVFILFLLLALMSDEIITYRKVTFCIAFIFTLALTVFFVIDYDYSHRWVNNWSIVTSVSLLVISLIVLLLWKKK